MSYSRQHLLRLSSSARGVYHQSLREGPGHAYGRIQPGVWAVDGSNGGTARGAMQSVIHQHRVGVSDIEFAAGNQACLARVHDAIAEIGRASCREREEV